MPFTPGYEEDGFLRQLGINPKYVKDFFLNQYNETKEECEEE